MRDRRTQPTPLTPTLTPTPTYIYRTYTSNPDLVGRILFENEVQDTLETITNDLDPDFLINTIIHPIKSQSDLNLSKSSDWSLKKTCRLIKLSKEMTNQHPKHNSINPTSFNPEDIRFHWPFHHPQGLDGGRTSNQTDSSDFKSMSYRSYSSLLNQTNSNSPFSISPTNPLPCSSIDLSSPVARRSSVTVQYLNFNLLGFFDLLSTLRTV